jgi:Tfp pilus assembly protein PilF
MEFLIKTRIPCLLLILASSGCQTTEVERDPATLTASNLDIKTEDEMAINREFQSERVGGVDAKPGKKTALQGVFDWQKMFKAPPTAKQRVELQKVVNELESATDEKQLLQRARNEVALGQFSKAEATYREILRSNRTHLDALTELGAVYHRVKNNESCLRVLADIKEFLATQEKPDKLAVFRYRYILALAMLQKGDRESGHDILSDLIGQERSFIPGYAALASSYLSIGKTQVAKFIIERGLDRGKDDATLYNLLGVIADREGRVGVARENFNKSLMLNDLFAPALVNRANIYIKSNEMRLAEGDLKKALEVDPLNIDAMISLAAVYRQTGRTSLCKAQLERVMDLAPESAEARYNMALLMRDNLKDNIEAKRLFSEVMQTEKASFELKAMAKAASDELKNF